jgi:hypothetical protein
MVEMAKSNYQGMTVNERLVVAGLVDQWDAAVRQRDRDGVIETLKQVDIGFDADKIADAVLKNPRAMDFSECSFLCRSHT